MVLAKPKSRSLLFNRKADCTKYLYDVAGRRLAVSDANNNRSTSMYNAASRKIASLNALNIRATSVFDAANQQIALIDGRANRTSSSYDLNGQQIYLMDALLRRTTFGYDAIGQRTQRTDARSYRKTYFFDANGRTTGWKYPDGTRATQAFDAIAQRTVLSDWTGRYTSSFDAVGQRLSVIDPNMKRITYGFDAMGERIAMRDPDGERFTYSYDAIGKLTLLRNPQNDRTSSTYDAVGRRTMQKLANLVRASMGYDAADRLVTLANVRSDGTYVSRYDYAYNNTSNKTSVIEADGTRVTWSYDQTYQLTRDRRSGVNAYNVTYSYDAAFNRNLEINGAARTTYTTDAANQLSWTQLNAGRTTYAFDSAGNQTVSRTSINARTTNVWDYDNRMIQVRLPDTTRNTFSYNADDLRIQKVDSLRTTNFIWDGKNYLEETDAVGAALSLYSSEPFQYGPLISQRRNATSYYHADGPNSVVQLTDSTARLTDSYIYYAFGSSVSSSGSTMNPFRYIGRIGYYYNLESLTYYVRRRWLSPSLGIWQSRDPLMITVSGDNKYVYCSNDPTLFRDPSGLIKISRRGNEQNLHKCNVPPNGPQSGIVWDIELSHTALCDGFVVQKVDVKCDVDRRCCFCGSPRNDCNYSYWEAFPIQKGSTGSYPPFGNGPSFIDTFAFNPPDSSCGSYTQMGNLRFFCRSQIGNLFTKWPPRRVGEPLKWYPTRLGNCDPICRSTPANLPSTDKPPAWWNDPPLDDEGNPYPLTYDELETFRWGMINWNCCVHPSIVFVVGSP